MSFRHMDSLLLFVILSSHPSILVSTYSDTRVNGTWQFLLPDGYKRADPPKRNDSAADVYVKLQISNVEDVNENEMYFVLHCVILDIWNDFRLTVQSSPYEFPYTFSVDGRTKIWKPDLTFANSKSGTMFPVSVPNTMIQLQKDASLYRLTRYNLKVGCLMDLHHFPMDTQKCEFIINLFSTTDSDALLHWVHEEGSPYKEEFSPSIEITAQIQPLQFYFTFPTPDKRVVKGLFGEHTHLVVKFIFSRRLTGNIVNTYIPSGLVVILSWVSFWIDVNAVPGRVTLGVTSILTLCTTIIQSRNNVMVNYLRAIDIWLLGCLMVVVASLIEYAMCYHFARKQRKPPFSEGRVLDSKVSPKSKEAWTNDTTLAVKPQPPENDEVHELATLKVLQYGPDAVPIVRLVKELSTAAARARADDDRPLLSSMRMLGDHNPNEMTEFVEEAYGGETLDKYSRVAFPLLSFGFAIGYWSYYYVVAF